MSRRERSPQEDSSQGSPVPTESLGAQAGAGLQGAEPAGELERALLAEAREGRLPCPAALRVVARLGVPAAEAGRAANRLGLKITGCQLGCFR